jgi:aspartate/methionine/tyrosine aminotransferase
MDRTPVASRLRTLGVSVFAEMSALAMKHGAVNLGQGFPDFPGPDFVKDAAKRAIDANLNQYAHPNGIPALRQAIAEDWSARYGQSLDVDREITVTSGATEAIFDCIQAFVEPGNEVITFEPYYDSYAASVLVAHGILRPVRLVEPEWSFDPEALARAVTPRTRAILLNTPHNPTGKVFTRAELETIAEIAIRHDLIVLTDEVYDRIVYPGHTHIPIATLPGMWERTLTINSTGKTFSLTGWKVGYTIGPAQLQEGLRSVHQFVTFATSTPFQAAFAEAIATSEERGYYRELSQQYDARRELLGNGLTDAGFNVLPVGGSYFLMASCPQDRFANDVEFARWLIEEIGVAPVPPSSFYREPETAPLLLRFCFAKLDATLIEASTRLQSVKTRLTKVAGEESLSAARP